MNTTGGDQFSKQTGQTGGTFLVPGSSGFKVTSVNRTRNPNDPNDAYRPTGDPNFQGATYTVHAPETRINPTLSSTYNEDDPLDRRSARLYDKLQEKHHPEDITRDEDGNEKYRQTSLLVQSPPILDMAASTHAGRSIPENSRAVATALAESKKRYGVYPRASSSTSWDSTPAANSMIEAGLLTGVEGKPNGEKAVRGNYVDRNWSENVVHSRYSEINPSEHRVPDEDVEQNVDVVKKKLVEHSRAKRAASSPVETSLEDNAPAATSAEKPKRSESFSQGALDFMGGK